MEAHRFEGDHEVDARATVAAVWRIESARLIANLARMTGDLSLAEDLAHDALVAALETWLERGVPENPGAWLTTTARNRGVDRIRRDQRLQRKYGHLALELDRKGPEPGPERSVLERDPTGDDVLTLLFTACHPALTTQSQVALTLKVVGGLSTGEIARAFLVPKATVAQRIVRAKKSLSEAKVGFERPDEEAMAKRLGAVLGVIYLIFNEGYAATEGEEWIRTDLSAEALRLGRILVGLAPEEPEAQGLLALMEIQASRFPARTGTNGEPILLQDQDRSRWDRLLIRLGLERIEVARGLGGDGPYLLQAEIAACHARAVTPEQTDWDGMVAAYDSLLEIRESPVTRLNRAVAVSMAGRTSEALEEVDRLAQGGSLEQYHLLPAVQGDLLEKLGRRDEAVVQFELAASLTENERERGVLEARARAARRF